MPISGNYFQLRGYLQFGGLSKPGDLNGLRLVPLSFVFLMCCEAFKESLPPHPPYQLIVVAGAEAAPSVHPITVRILRNASANPAEAAASGSVAAPEDLLDLAANVD